MRWHKTLRLRLRSLFRSGRVERELGDELQFHLEHLVDDFVASGMSREEAGYAARCEMGAIEARKDDCRDARGLVLFEATRRDVIYALRALRKSPGIAIVSIVSLALGIGANTAIFSLWHGIVRASLPGVANPDEIVILSNPDDQGSWNGRTTGVRSWLSYAEFEQMRDHVAAFSGVMASQSSLATWRVRIDGGAPEEARGRLVSGGFFDVLGVGPAIGRVFSPADDRTDTTGVVISHSYWQRRFGGRGDVLGTALTIRNAMLTVIGVTPRGFIGETSGQQPDFWLPLRVQPMVTPDADRLHDTPPENSMWLHVFGRLRPGVTPAQAEAQANAVFHAGLESFYGAAASGARRHEFLDQQLHVQPAARGASAVRGELSSSLTTLLAAVGVLLLIACANLANLLLARGAARASEIALRLSLGASRGRIVRQLVTESLALATVGGLASIAVAGIFHGALVQLLAQSDNDFAMRFTIDPFVLAFVVAATVGATLLFGALPAWQATKTDPVAALKDQHRGAGGPVGHLRSGRLLVSLQLALSLPLLVGAGLLARTVYNLQRADLGFPAERLLLVRVDLHEAGYVDARRQRVLGDLIDVLRRIPGVQSASFSQLGVFTGGESATSVAVEGYVPKNENDHDSALDVIGPGYFSTLGVPMRLGRDIQDSDRGDGMAVCVINDAFARHYFAGRDPIGRRISLINDDGHASYQIVGVANDARTHALRGAVAPRYFVAVRKPASSSNSPTLLIRTTAAPAAVLPAVRKAIEQVDRAIPIMSAVPIEAQMAPLVAQDRATAQLAVVFGIVALTLAAIGLYGVLSYGVARRTGEIAIRIALGAQAHRVISMILRETAAVVCVGLVVGGGLAWAAARLIDSRLYGVAPQDPLTLVMATGLLLAVALSAAFVPAHRAARLNPIAALRHE